MFAVTRTRTAVGLLAAAAVAAPSAAAMPTDSGPQAAIAAGASATDATGGYDFAPAPPAPPPAATRIVEVHTASGFDWGDAGLGAAAMLSALGVGAGAVVVARRGRPTVGKLSGAPGPARRASSRRSGSRPSCSPGATAAARDRSRRPRRPRC